MAQKVLGKTKLCAHCRKEKLVTQFFHNKSQRDNVDYICRECRLSYYRKWYYQNLEHTHAVQRNYYLANHDKVLASRGRSRLRHLDREKASCRHWARTHPFRIWAHSTLGGHKRCGFEIAISLDELENMAKETSACSICNMPLDYGQSGSKRFLCGNSPTLDRKFNGTVISKDTTWILCRRCNMTKYDRTWDDFLVYCSEVLKKFAPNLLMMPPQASNTF